MMRDMIKDPLAGKWFSELPAHRPDMEFVERILRAAERLGWRTTEDTRGDVAIEAGDRRIRISVLPRGDGKKSRGRLKVTDFYGSGGDVEQYDRGWRLRLGGKVVEDVTERPERLIEVIGNDE